MFLTWKENQKTQALYIPVANYKEAQLWNENYKKLKKQIKKVSEQGGEAGLRFGDVPHNRTCEITGYPAHSCHTNL